MTQGHKQINPLVNQRQPLLNPEIFFFFFKSRMFPGFSMVFLLGINLRPELFKEDMENSWANMGTFAKIYNMTEVSLVK